MKFHRLTLSLTYDCIVYQFDYTAIIGDAVMRDDYALDAELYDIIYADYDDDINFYVEEAIQANGPCLELGCGSGRILLPVAAAGVTVTGVDVSQPMLARLRRKVGALPPEVGDRVTVVRGDMRTVQLDTQFALIYIPFRAFLHLLQVEDQIAALHNIHRHLQPGGRLALNFFNPSLEYIVAHSGPIGGALHATGETFRDPRTNHLLVEYATIQYHQHLQRIEQYFIYDEIDRRGRVVGRLYRSLRMRYIFRWEFEHLLHRCGFEVVTLYGSFDRQPHLRSDQELIWIAQKHD
jgi:SAM-dependent methyltransferase